MNKIAVNPTQFITCRLCLDELGNYQIVPSVKEQIEYCFGIKVEPFDGLPQLICQKCEEILSNYSKIKKNFTGKQDELIRKVFNLQESQHVKLFSAEQAKEESQRNSESKSNGNNLSKPIKRRNSNSSSSSDLEYNNTFKNTKLNRGRYCSNEEIGETWPASYTKQFVCRICGSHWSNVKALKSHINNKHGALNKKYSYIFKRQCKVMLYKSDGKPNITGSRSKVVFGREKVVKNVNADYHIIYTTKDYKGYEKYNAPRDKARGKKSRSIVKKKSYFSSDSSDEEDMVVKRKRKIRFNSRSSNETVVLDSHANMSENDDESKKSEMVQSPEACINLDDSSETESEKSMNPVKTTPEKQKSENVNCGNNADQFTIDEIITTCRNKYLKKHYQETNQMKNPFEIANKLQHKIFSIGCKIINKRINVNCTPLLRFMEHKNLDIAWLPRPVVNVCQNSNYIRIMPRRKNAEEKFEDNEKGWTDYTSTKSSKSNNSAQSHNQLNKWKEISTPESPSVGISGTAVISDANIICTETKKLLNANPVANPKQLPKKIVTNETKIVKIGSKATENSLQEDNNSVLCMPIITSTTSLAVPYSVPVDNNDPNKKSEIHSTTTDKQQSEAPRIKVKPVSELMSAETLNRMQNSEQSPMQIPINVIGKGLPLVVQNITVPCMTTPQNTGQLPRNDNINLSASASAWQSEFMILDTIELPNTRTNSPYAYLKKLLETHNITLLDTHVALSDEFHCLIKFKVQYKQDIQHQPVILCLALFCSNNVFCFKVKDRNNEDLDITKISANWQWEVLKIYKGEVVNKLLSNAQAISKEVYSYTNTFLCLLKSINVKRP